MVNIRLNSRSSMRAYKWQRFFVNDQGLIQKRDGISMYRDLPSTGKTAPIFINSGDKVNNDKIEIL